MKTNILSLKQPDEDNPIRVNSTQEENFLNHKRNRSISKEKRLYANSSYYYDNNNNYNNNYNNSFCKNNSYFPKHSESFSNSNFNNKSKEEDHSSRTNQIPSNSNYSQYNTHYKTNSDSNNYNNNPTQQFESKLKSNKLFSNAIAKVTSSFLKEKKVSPDSFRRK